FRTRITQRSPELQAHGTREKSSSSMIGPISRTPSAGLGPGRGGAGGCPGCRAGTVAESCGPYRSPLLGGAGGGWSRGGCSGWGGSSGLGCGVGAGGRPGSGGGGSAGGCPGGAGGGSAGGSVGGWPGGAVGGSVGG